MSIFDDKNFINSVKTGGATKIAFNAESLQTIYGENANGIWKFDSPETGLKSSQQIKIDYSNFVNHCFFNSAEAKVNLAFNKIINEYPFDGTESEFLEYVDSLDGYQKYILDNFPKSSGYLTFTSNDSQYVEAPDKAGALFTSISRRQDNRAVVGPSISKNGFTIESYISLPTVTAENNIVFQKLSGNGGVSLVISGSDAADSSTKISLYVSSASNGTIISNTVDADINKGDFNFVVAKYDKSSNKLSLQVNETKSVSTGSLEIGYIDFNSADILLGSGSNHTLNGQTFIASQTFTGSIDEFRLWGKIKSDNEIQNSRYGIVYQNDD